MDEIKSTLGLILSLQKDMKKDIGKLDQKIDNVEKVTFTSKETIKNDMMSEYPSFSKMMDSWKENDNPFQDSYGRQDSL